MATEDRDHDYDERIAEGIRAMADGDERLTSPPANLWGRIERAIDGTAQGADLVTPPPDLWDRIADDVRAEDLPLAVPQVGPRRRHRVALVAAAIVAVGAIVAGAFVLGRDDGGSGAEIVAKASLTGKGLDPGGDGKGSAELLQDADGWEVDIQIDRLPSPPAGSYYEAWLLGSGPGQVQSLGTLEGVDGFAVPEGLAIDDYPLVDVSIEPIDGNPAHSSKSVLRGRLAAS